MYTSYTNSKRFNRTRTAYTVIALALVVTVVLNYRRRLTRTAIIAFYTENERSRLHSPCNRGIMKSLRYNLQKKNLRVQLGDQYLFYGDDKPTPEVNKIYTCNISCTFKNK